MVQWCGVIHIFSLTALERGNPDQETVVVTNVLDVGAGDDDADGTVRASEADEPSEHWLKRVVSRLTQGPIPTGGPLHYVRTPFRAARCEMGMRSRPMAAHRRGTGQSARGVRAGSEPVIFIVDADEQTRRDLQTVLGGMYATRAFDNVSTFFAEHDPEIHGCIIIESNPPSTDGLATLARLVATHCGQPVIFLSAHASIATTVKALRAGAINFLTKPVNTDILLAAVNDALRLEANRHESVYRRRDASQRLSALTARERQVLGCLVRGMLNKQIAAQLGVVENTVKAHRARIMQKLAVRSLAELVLLASTTDPGAVPARQLLELRNFR